MDRRGSTAPAPPPAPKPFKDYLPQLMAFTGDNTCPPEAFLAQYRLHARQNKVPSDERARQLSAKLAGAAQDWFNLEFSRQPEAATDA